MNKKRALANFGAASGATRLLEALPGRASLIVLNYHRVGDASRTPYDSGTFSCTTAEFDWQVDYLKRHFEMLDLNQALEIVHRKAVPARPSVLLTFDDGYRDNYDEAFPVLRKHNASATFFLVTSFVGTGVLPWWDVIAFVVKHSKHNTITLSYPHPVTFDLSLENRSRAVVSVLNLFKSAAVRNGDKFIAELQRACDAGVPGNAERCFLSWDEAREMKTQGMCFGSHTHNHHILGKLPYEKQLEEVAISRDILQREFQAPIDTLAYPRGKSGSFTGDTVKALAAANYTTAFSYRGGINHPGKIDAFDVLRIGVDAEPRSVFRLRMATLAAARRSVI